MISNVPASDSAKMDIVPSPIVIFTKHDANLAARQCPIVEQKNHVNVVIVTTSIRTDQVIRLCCNFLVTHHAQNIDTGESKVVGSWEVKDVPVIQNGERHQFTVRWPEESR